MSQVVGIQNKRKSEASIGSNPFPGTVEKKFSSHSNRKNLNIEITMPGKKAGPPPVPTSSGHMPIKHYATTNFGKKFDLSGIGAQSTSSPSRLAGGNEILSKVSRSPSDSGAEEDDI